MLKKEIKNQKFEGKSDEKKGVKQYKLNSKKNFLYGIQPVLKALQYRRRNLVKLYIKKNFDSSIRLREIKKIAEKLSIKIYYNIFTTHYFI